VKATFLARSPPSSKSGAKYTKPNFKTIGNVPSALNRWTESKEPTVIKVLNARKLDTFKLEIDFSDRTQGVFDAAAYLATRSGPLLDKLRDPNYFSRFFIDAGALCWPNGLEISPAKVHELSAVRTIA
jgi:hypothetical protein